MNDQVKGLEPKSVPSWFPIAGYAAGGVTLLFFMYVATSQQVQPTFAHVIVTALGVALAAAFLGGDAAAKGSLPIPLLKEQPMAFTVGGGIATFVIVLVLGSALFLGQDPRARVSVRAVPEVVSIAPLPEAERAKYPGIYGFQAVTYEFREVGGTDVDFNVQTYQFFTLDGRPVNDVSREHRLLDGGFTVPARSSHSYTDNHGIGDAIVERAREIGVKAINLKTVFLGTDSEGRTYELPAVLLIYL
ncbi:MAG TPA: hypothetical protein VI485_21230 [Vicinamibacterales bacterium]|nr:hypothetical protein [Vicinamibacterales bacterium]